MEFEFNRVGIRPHFFSAFDSDSSLDIPKVVNNLSASTSMSKSFDGHLTHSHLSAVVNAMTPGAVAYKLSQRAIFQDALDKGYERICVFDDDVFFADFSSHRLCKFLTQSNFCWKIVALGASDNSIEIRLSQDTAIKALDEAGFYSPIPGKTCGSFAMMYERSVFQEIIEGCDEAVGTFDNSIIGALYARYPESCFVMFPNIVSPCVEESDIRASRVQSVQSRRMFWDIRNFKRWVEGGVV